MIFLFKHLLPTKVHANWLKNKGVMDISILGHSSPNGGCSTYNFASKINKKFISNAYYIKTINARAFLKKIASAELITVFSKGKIKSKCE